METDENKVCIKKTETKEWLKWSLMIGGFLAGLVIFVDFLGPSKAEQIVSSIAGGVMLAAFGNWFYEYLQNKSKKE